MINLTPQRIRRVWGIATAASLGISAVCLAVSCVGIYQTGEFTREIVAQRFSPIALPCCLSLILAAAGLVLDLFLPAQKEKPTVPRQRALLLARLQGKADLACAEESLRTAIAAQQTTRRRLNLLRKGTYLICTLAFLAYALNAGNFHTSQINGSMIQAMTVLLPCLAVSGAVTMVTEKLGNASMDAQIALLKQAPVRSPAQQPSAEAAQPARKLPALRTVILAAAIGLLIFGFLTGGTADVLTKAVNICTECVGLG